MVEGELDATLEVRLRMPARHLGGDVAPPERAARDISGADLTEVFGPVPDLPVQWLAPPYATLPSGATIVPTACDVLRLRALFDAGPVVLDSDRDVFASDVKHLSSVDVANARKRPLTGRDLDAWRADYRDMVAAAAAVTVPTQALADVYREAGAREVYVIANAVDPAQLHEPARWFESFGVGYAGGSGHEDSLELIRRALEWAAGEPDVESVIFGANEDEALTRGGDWRFCDHLSWTASYADYQYQLSGLFDVGLMPLAEGEYNRGRSDLKVCEYAMAGALPIVQDCENYAAWRDTPVLFARDADEFLEHVQWAVAHRGEVRERAMAAREYVLRERTIERTLPLWREALGVSPRTAAAVA
jgi:hypothetical protein